MTDEHRVIFTLDTDAVRQVAGVAKAASRDNARPALQTMHVEWGHYFDDDGKAEGWEIRFVCTDSYMLAIRTLRPEQIDAGTAGSATIESASLFAKQLTATLNTAKPIINGEGVIVGIGHKTVEFANSVQADASTTLPLSDTTFPNYKQLVPEPSRRKDDTDALWAFNPGYMVQLMGAVATTAAVRDRAPIKMFATAPTENSGGPDSLRPIGFTITAGHTGKFETFTGLLMPVRV